MIDTRGHLFRRRLRWASFAARSEVSIPLLQGDMSTARMVEFTGGMSWRFWSCLAFEMRTNTKNAARRSRWCFLLAYCSLN